NKMTYWKDPHNRNLKYKRVSVRKMISDTESYTQQDIVEPLSRTARMAAEDADALDVYTDSAYNVLEQNEWSIEYLQDIPKAVRKRAYRKKLLTMNAYSDSISFEITNRIDEFVSYWRGQGAVSISNDINVYRVNKTLV